ncbi:MAG: hypothetical protein PHU86_00995, partial [Patescibacteria group bacterium]|nr:hypothetical protein [Patescibacteria group bacterium]
NAGNFKTLKPSSIQTSKSEHIFHFCLLHYTKIRKPPLDYTKGVAPAEGESSAGAADLVEGGQID